MLHDNLERIIALRHELHQYPELSGQERWTKKRLVKFIQEHTSLEIHDRGRWFYAVYRTASKSTPVKIAFRADFDAIKMEERLDIPHKSTNDGVAHKCGHDGHSAIVAGLALEIYQCGADADIFFLFQFGEEDGSGAKECAVFIDENQIDFIYALHNMSGLEKNTIAVRDGITHYASTGMVIELTGVPSHASEPEKGRNPAFAIAEIVTKLPIIVHGEAVETSDLFSGKIFCTVIHIALGEEAFGISAGHGKLLLTLRAEYEADMVALQNAVEQYATVQAEAHQLAITIDYVDRFPETCNHTMSCDAIRRLTEYGFDVRELEHPFRASEDFGYYLKKTSGAMFYLGNGMDYPAIHTYEFDFNDQIIETGVEAFKALIALS